MEHTLSLYPNILALLTANPSVVDFYPRFGFKQTQAYKPEIVVAIDNGSKNAIKCKLDDANFMNLLYDRRCYSKTADCINTQSVQMFHLLSEYADDIYFLPNLDTAIIGKQDGNRLFLADVIARKPLTFELLMRELPFSDINVVEFGFSPDWLDVTPEWIPLNMDDELLFLRGEWNLPEYFRFPVMSET
jgi:hypothetical protein